MKRAEDEGSRFVTEQTHIVSAVKPLQPASGAALRDHVYDMRRLSYAGTFSNPFKAGTIRAIEWLTAKITLLRLIRQFERSVRQGRAVEEVHVVGSRARFYGALAHAGSIIFDRNVAMRKCENYAFSSSAHGYSKHPEGGRLRSAGDTNGGGKTNEDRKMSMSKQVTSGAQRASSVARTACVSAKSSIG